MTPDESPFRRYRGDILKGYLAVGFSRARAEEVVDLAIHAAEEAVETVARVCISSSDSSMTAMHITSQLLGFHFTFISAHATETLVNEGAPWAPVILGEET